jgi:protein tyrosine/serine phosphatase
LTNFSYKQKRLAVILTVLAAAITTLMALVEHACLANLENRSSATDLPLASEIPNFSEVQPYLYRGALPTPFGMVWLQKHHIGTIIDLREANSPPVIGEQITANSMGFHYVNLPVKNLPTLEQIDRFQKIVSDARDHDRRVFVHCNYGSDRTGFFVMLWRITGDHWRWSLALCEMIEHGFFVHKFSDNKSKPLSDPANW